MFGTLKLETFGGRKPDNSSRVKKLLLVLIVFVIVTPDISSARTGITKIAGRSNALRQSGEDDPNIVILKAVWDRLLAVASPSPGLAWPPQLHVLTDDDMAALKMNPQGPNAFSTIYKGTPLVCVNKALLNSIVEGNTSRLGFILGHELSHITLGHVGHPRPGSTLLLMMVFSREKELAADRNGIMLALAANYDFNEAMSGPKRFIELGMEYPP